jgi:hypothetical protein
MKIFGGEKMNYSQKPVARKEGLVIQEMPEEVLVYDLQTNKAHCLNQTAAFVWKNCDGENSVADIVKQLASETGDDIQNDLVWLAIDQLGERDLLEATVPSKFAGESRRSVLKKIGFASMVALPVIASLTAPTAVMAAACTGVVNGDNGECSACSNQAPCTCPATGGGTVTGTCAGNNGSTCTTSQGICN